MALTARKDVMFKIGDFSRISRVPAKTLRYYDEIGLLKPAHVDPENGYRYYALDQLTRLHTILALKDLDFSLEQIARMLDDDLSVEQIRGMLKMKQAEIERRVVAEQGRLGRVEARLKQIEENIMPQYEPVIKELAAQRIAALRAVIPTYAAMSELFSEIAHELDRQGVQPTGAPYVMYWDEGYKESDVDIEIGAPIDGVKFEETDRVKVRDIPATQVISVLRPGPYDDFGPAYEAIMRWVEASEYRICGPNREIYLQGPDDPTRDPSDYLTEIQFPITHR